MKYSNYNLTLEINERITILYNTRSDQFVLIKKEVLDHGELLLPEDLRKNAPETYQHLVVAGAIIEDGIDEIQQTKDYLYAYHADHRSFQLMVNPTMNCNFRCWYCYENHIPNSKLSPETITRIFKLLDRKLTGETNEFNISFFGGEPLLYYQETVKPLVDYVGEITRERQLNTSISFTSNGYLINDRIIENLLSARAKVSFQITLDGDREHHNKTRGHRLRNGSYDKIIQNISKLTHQGIYVVLRINYTAENIESVATIANDISHFSETSRQNLHIDFHQVWQDKSSVNNEKCDKLLEQVSEAFTTNGIRVNTKYQVNLANYSCYADKPNQLLVNYNGDIYKCTARDFKTENRLGYLDEQGYDIWVKQTPLELLRSKINFGGCEKCILLPLCGGTCMQRVTETEDAFSCPYREADFIKQMIIDKFHSYFIGS